METSQAAQVIVAIIPIVGIVMAAVVAFFYLLWGHREKVRLIERGLFEPGKLDVEAFCLLAGILLTCVGAVLTVMFIVLGTMSYALLGGLIPLAAGIGLLIFFSMRRGRYGA
jgi:hypothetical protein